MTEHNLQIETLPALKDGERRVFYIEVGNMPGPKAMEYVRKVRDELAGHPDGVAYFAPMRHGVKTVVVETIKEEK